MKPAGSETFLDTFSTPDSPSVFTSWGENRPRISKFL